ncbi:hypothetical protein C8R44DRAFT_946482 [Mycena epipterygia]|nr:hypothetical protein C8R44DRAFT_946482 [Mycena epipterygia]
MGRDEMRAGEGARRRGRHYDVRRDAIRAGAASTRGATAPLGGGEDKRTGGPLAAAICESKSSVSALSAASHMVPRSRSRSPQRWSSLRAIVTRISREMHTRREHAPTKTVLASASAFPVAKKKKHGRQKTHLCNTNAACFDSIGTVYAVGWAGRAHSFVGSGLTVGESRGARVHLEKIGRRYSSKDSPRQCSARSLIGFAGTSRFPPSIQVVPHRSRARTGLATKIHFIYPIILLAVDVWLMFMAAETRSSGHFKLVT